MSSGFWRGRPVFLTGHTGFKGSWLSLWLQQLGARLTGYALPAPTTPSLFELAGVADGMTSVIGDITQLPELDRAMSAAQPEVVFHMAAQALVRPSYADPVGTYLTNVQGTAHLLEAVRRCPSVRAVVVITTDKCYQNNEWSWGYREIDPLGGHDPYSSSKACAELVSAAYRASFFVPEGRVALATARAGNVFGGGDFAPDRLIPDFVRAKQTQVPLDIRYPEAVRPWQHVLEPLGAYLELAEALIERGAAVAEAFNFGPEDRDARSVRWVITGLAEAWGEPDDSRLAATPSLHEATFLKLDCSKARARLGWAPRLSLEDGLSWTVEWYKAWLGHDDLRALCHAQLQRFEELA